MKHALPTIGIVLGLVVTPASADPWKDESGKGRWGYDRGPYRAYNYDREYKQEYHRGHCKIERKWGKHGEYKEETKCKGYRD
ncbi:hypothetical protein [Bradyrhizobium sp. DASA03007]|uniref:hypothetical protein n=1 Tax=unclassified Bradyrhizobium TaxID=2631580 RepID=UPI003F6F0A3F